MAGLDAHESSAFILRTSAPPRLRSPSSYPIEKIKCVVGGGGDGGAALAGATRPAQAKPPAVHLWLDRARPPWVRRSGSSVAGRCPVPSPRYDELREGNRFPVPREVDYATNRLHNENPSALGTRDAIR